MAIYRTATRRFLDRFDPRDGHWVYRAFDRSPGVHVTDAERDRLATQFHERTILLYVTYAAALPLAAGITRMTLHPALAPKWLVATMPVFLVVAILVAAAVWRAAAPRLLLHGRAPIDEGPSPEDRKRRKDAAETWSTIAGSFLYEGLIIFAYSHLGPETSAWLYWLWVIFICNWLVSAIFRVARLARRENGRRSRP